MTTKTQTAAERAAEAIERDAYVSNTYTSSSEFDRELAVSIITREYAELERAAEVVGRFPHDMGCKFSNTGVLADCTCGLLELRSALKRVRRQR